MKSNKLNKTLSILILVAIESSPEKCVNSFRQDERSKRTLTQREAVAVRQL